MNNTHKITVELDIVPYALAYLVATKTNKPIELVITEAIFHHVLELEFGESLEVRYALLDYAEKLAKDL